jgi:hypothetical protein
VGNHQGVRPAPRRPFRIGDTGRRYPGRERRRVPRFLPARDRHCAGLDLSAHPDCGADRFPLYKLTPGQLYINFGFWDVVRRPTRFAPHHFNRIIEDKVSRLGGIKSLYSESYFSRDAFDQIYGGDDYRRLKAKYDRDNAFPTLYEKCVLRT